MAVLGASGGIGQPLSLLLKQLPSISQLNLYDIIHTPGVAADLSHIETRAQVKGYLGPKDLHQCLDGSDIVLIPAGVPRKPGLYACVSSLSMVFVLYKPKHISYLLILRLFDLSVSHCSIFQKSDNVKLAYVFITPNGG